MPRLRRVLSVAARVALLAALLAAGLYLVGWLRQRGAETHRPFKSIPVERLTYHVTSWLGESGTLVAEVGPLRERPDGSGAYRVVYTLETADAISAAYVLKGQVTVLLDAATLLPLEYEEKLITGLGVTGGREKHKKFVYDHARHTLTYYRDRGHGLELRRARAIPPGAQHYASLAYWLRAASLTPNGRLEVPVSVKRRDLTVALEVLREEPYEAPNSSVRTAVVLRCATSFGHEDIEGAEFRVWLDRAERFVVRVDAATPWGTISAELTERRVLQEPSTTSQ